VIGQLVFTLCAPHGSWGSASRSSATTAYKATDLDPSKSALIGLLGAALGLPRDRLGSLSESLLVAVRTGIRPLRDPKPDWHTITRVPVTDGPGHGSRFPEARGHLSGADHSGALLSRREYWTCGLWSVAVCSAAPEWPVAALRDALAAPRWMLYAGRKACTLGLPPDPVVIEAPGPVEALASYGWPWDRHPALGKPLEPLKGRVESQAATAELAFDRDYPGAPSIGPDQTGRDVRRRDRCDPLALPGGRIYQRFHERTEVRTAWELTR
jgi:CRISPR system Cascade subunit CasD